MFDREDNFGPRMKAAFEEVCPKKMEEYDFGLFDHKMRVEIFCYFSGGERFFFHYGNSGLTIEPDDALKWSRHAATIVNAYFQEESSNG